MTKRLRKVLRLWLCSLQSPRRRSEAVTQTPVCWSRNEPAQRVSTRVPGTLTRCCNIYVVRELTNPGFDFKFQETEYFCLCICGLLCTDPFPGKRLCFLFVCRLDLGIQKRCVFSADFGTVHICGRSLWGVDCWSSAAFD